MLNVFPFPTRFTVLTQQQEIIFYSLVIILSIRSVSSQVVYKDFLILSRVFRKRLELLWLKALLDARIGLHDPRVGIAQTPITTSPTSIKAEGCHNIKVWLAVCNSNPFYSASLTHGSWSPARVSNKAFSIHLPIIRLTNTFSQYTYMYHK